MPLFFAQLFGLYFIIVAIIVFLRGSSLMPAIRELVSNRSILLVLGFVEIMAGLALVITYPTLSWDWMGAVALIGWVILIEGVVYVALPSRMVQKMVRWFNRPLWYQTGAALSLVAGIYLAGTGFGLF